MGVDDIRDGVIVYVSGEAEDVFNNGDSFFFSLMGEHRAFNNISDSEDAFDLRFPVFVNGNSAELISLDVDVLKSKA
jgi:hypothetical protein